MSNTEIIEAFIGAFNRMDWDAIDDLMAEDIFYHNIPMQPIEGRAAASAFLRGMDPVGVYWELLSIAENGNKVLTERVDNFDLAGGKKLSLPVMGTFEIENGKIQAWRDYFDLGSFASQMA
ncbi:MAG TPA: limonene-1,2-epoxide hydrolase [Myxococcales bacterium]|nr:limonene-1,2-epoxide hydrolase [Myxococcales bacterium]HIK86310.1 limonene-1,2-epoxide hydrolase [Myxococcales bacterium]